MLLGFDIGGTKCAVILGESDASSATIKIIDKIVFATSVRVDEMILSLFAGATTLLSKNNIAFGSIKACGISCGGPLDSKNGMILCPPNLPDWVNIPIVELTKKRFGKPALLQNDANACAIAEWKYGAGRGYNNLVFLTFGTGMGAGLILNGKLYSGANDMAGEVGHMRLSDSGPVGYGKNGSFEGFCSGGGIAQLAQMKATESFNKGEQPSFCNKPEEQKNITAKRVADAAFAGNQDALDIFETSAEYLGKGLAVIVDFLNPELIIIGSIYKKTQALMEPYMMEVLKKEALPHNLQACKIVPSALGDEIGDYAALALADSCVNI